MPFGNGTGPTGPGRGLGRGGGRGRQPGGFGLGPGGDCICPNCKTRTPHQRGIPCYEQKCPKCGSLMTRIR
jgi:hypothetical protein